MTVVTRNDAPKVHISRKDTVNKRGCREFRREETPAPIRQSCNECRSRASRCPRVTQPQCSSSTESYPSDEADNVVVTCGASLTQEYLYAEEKVRSSSTPRRKIPLISLPSLPARCYTLQEIKGNRQSSRAFCEPEIPPAPITNMDVTASTCDDWYMEPVSSCELSCSSPCFPLVTDIPRSWAKADEIIFQNDYNSPTTFDFSSVDDSLDDSSVGQNNLNEPHIPYIDFRCGAQLERSSEQESYFLWYSSPQFSSSNMSDPKPTASSSDDRFSVTSSTISVSSSFLSVTSSDFERATFNPGSNVSASTSDYPAMSSNFETNAFGDTDRTPSSISALAHPILYQPQNSSYSVPFESVVSNPSPSFATLIHFSSTIGVSKLPVSSSLSTSNFQACDFVGNHLFCENMECEAIYTGDNEAVENRESDNHYFAEAMDVDTTYSVERMEVDVDPFEEFQLQSSQMWDPTVRYPSHEKTRQ